MKLLSVKDEQRLNNLITKVGLPQRIERIKVSSIMELMLHDKKFVAGRNRFVLATAIGKVKVLDGISKSTIIQAIKSIF